MSTGEVVEVREKRGRGRVYPRKTWGKACQIRGVVEYDEWLAGFAAHMNVTLVELYTCAVQRLACEVGYPEGPPRLG
jgi:hypothetical protein